MSGHTPKHVVTIGDMVVVEDQRDFDKGRPSFLVQFEGSRQEQEEAVRLLLPLYKNPSLLFAAPELLEACEALVAANEELLERHGTGLDTAKARAAIAKARGES